MKNKKRKIAQPAGRTEKRMTSSKVKVESNKIVPAKPKGRGA